MATLELSDRARVLHAALNFPTFTVDDLAAFSSVKAPTVRSTIDRAKDLIERVGLSKSEGAGGRSIVYRLKKHAREKLAAELIALTRSLGQAPAPNAAAALRRAAAAIDAAESSLGFAKDPGESGESGEDWRKRAASQLALGEKLVSILPDGDERSNFEKRLKGLNAQLEAPERTTSIEDWREVWKEFFDRLVPSGTPAHEPVFSYAAALAKSTEERRAPAAIFGAVDDPTVAKFVAEGLQAAQRPVMEFRLDEVLAQLEKPAALAAMYRALERTPRDLAFIVMLDSADDTSRRSVNAFLTHMKKYLWSKEQQSRMGIVPEVALIDKAIDRRLLKANVLFRNIEYMPNVKGGAVSAAVAAVVNSRSSDASHFFARSSERA